MSSRNVFWVLGSDPSNRYRIRSSIPQGIRKSILKSILKIIFSFRAGSGSVPPDRQQTTDKRQKTTDNRLKQKMDGFLHLSLTYFEGSPNLQVEVYALKCTNGIPKVSKKLVTDQTQQGNSIEGQARNFVVHHIESLA